MQWSKVDCDEPNGSVLVKQSLPLSRLAQHGEHLVRVLLDARLVAVAELAAARDEQVEARAEARLERQVQARRGHLSGRAEPPDGLHAPHARTVE